MHNKPYKALSNPKRAATVETKDPDLTVTVPVESVTEALLVALKDLQDKAAIQLIRLREIGDKLHGSEGEGDEITEITKDDACAPGILNEIEREMTALAADIFNISRQVDRLEVL